MAWNKAQHSQELLLILNEDGSFQQYMDSLTTDVEEDDDDEDEEPSTSSKKGKPLVDVNDQWSKFQKRQQTEHEQPTTTTGTTSKNSLQAHVDSNDADDEATYLSVLSNQLAKGVWDYVDGKLILAADRPDPKDLQLQQASDGHVPSSSQTNKDEDGDEENSFSGDRGGLDKLIVGRVVASSTTTKPVSQQSSGKPSKEASSPNKDATPTSSARSLSVPKGSLKMGKFFYPKNHPHFFEQPIYNPTTAHRRFQLKQVLGSARDDEKSSSSPTSASEWTGKPPFERCDFYNKTFLLSSHPLRQPNKPRHRPFQQHTQEMWNKPKKGQEPNAVNPHAESAPIRVMQVRFFPNNTFATIWGTGDVILRGKFDTFVRDTYNGRFASQSSSQSAQPPTVALWMQIMRFGFGRSVSGSVYSEGRTLTHEDAKTYWGSIRRVNVTVLPEASSYEDVVVGETSNDNAGSSNVDSNSNQSNNTRSILEVEGSVLFGTGIGAEPVGRFLMREMMQDLQTQDDEEEEEEEEDDEDEEEEDPSSISLSDLSLPSSTLTTEKDDSDDGVDWTSYGSSDNAFQ